MTAKKTAAKPQQATDEDPIKAFREKVDAMSEKELRLEGEQRGIPDPYGLDIPTLRNHVFWDERDKIRIADAQKSAYDR